MCPDYQILSVYFDGELPSPWKEKMETHLGSCPACQAQLARFRQYSQILRASPQGIKHTPGTPDVEVHQKRVWEKVCVLDTEHWHRRRRNNLWGRTIAVPLPAAAAAAAVFFIAFAVAVTRELPRSAPPQEALTASGGMTDMQGIVPVSDMNDVLQYLGNQDTTDIVIIRLPESRSFFSSGEPTILKAADYSRSAGTR
ncbi:MAG: hypothetical protein LBD29_05180 [Treponema sp.]|nr:hypothetical protein [Treponema sp.]